MVRPLALAKSEQGWGLREADKPVVQPISVQDLVQVEVNELSLKLN